LAPPSVGLSYETSRRSQLFGGKENTTKTNNPYPYFNLENKTKFTEAPADWPERSEKNNAVR